LRRSDRYTECCCASTLAASLPDAPLREFQAKIKDLPKTTEERLVVQRIGQDIFRARLIEYWQGRCPLTGISDTALLRASRIVPWKDCASDAERLDVHNGLLLSALWDAAFDRGLATFEDDGHPLLSTKLSETARAELRWQNSVSLTDKHRARLSHSSLTTNDWGASIITSRLPRTHSPLPSYPTRRAPGVESGIRRTRGLLFPSTRERFPRGSRSPSR
jgi:hypothetical protein